MRLAHALAAVAMLAWATLAGAHETDLYKAPLGRQYADLGPYLTSWVYRTLVDSVDEQNRRIDAASELGDTAVVARLRTPDSIAALVASHYPNAYSTIEGFEQLIYTDGFRRRYPGQIGGYKELFTHSYRYAHPVWDFRQVFKFWFASTVKAFDSYLGNDKLGHFTDMGKHYYLDYRAALARGMSEDEAIREALKKGTEHPIFSEAGVCGMVSSGTYSHGDLMSNYAGFLFYRNLTEPIELKGVLRPPLLKLENGHWRLAPHVQRNSDFFSYFISDHWDEALNPNFYDPVMRPGVIKAMREEAEGVLARYVDERGCRRPPEWFEAKAAELRTYYGKDYGHRGTPEDLITIADALYEPFDDGAALTAFNTAGYTPLHMAVIDGDESRVQALLSRGANPDIRSRSAKIMLPDNGVTPLHLAARDGEVAIARMLLAAGAQVNARGETGITPLHWAGRHPAIITLLLSEGGDVKAADVSGQTPAHWMAMSSEPGLTIVLGRGADVNGADARGQTPLHLAAGAGKAQAVRDLLAAGADADVRDRSGTTPLHLAAGGGHTGAAEALLSGGASPDATDDYGRTPLHRAARSGRTAVVAALTDRGANPNQRDVFGTTPLHLAARYGFAPSVQTLLEHGADPAVASASGVTALHEAAFANDVGSITLLIRSGADTGVRDARGLTPRSVALQHRNSWAAATLAGQVPTVFAMPTE